MGPVTVTTDDYKTLQVCLIYSIYLNGSFYDSYFLTMETLTKFPFFTYLLLLILMVFL